MIEYDKTERSSETTAMDLYGVCRCFSFGLLNKKKKFVTDSKGEAVLSEEPSEWEGLGS